MVLVPIFGIALKHKTGIPTWIGAIIAAIGLYFISVTKGSSINRGDFLVLLCSFCFAFHVLLIDHYSKKVEPVLLASIQFAWCSAISLITAVLIEDINIYSIV